MAYIAMKYMKSNVYIIHIIRLSIEETHKATGLVALAWLVVGITSYTYTSIIRCPCLSLPMCTLDFLSLTYRWGSRWASGSKWSMAPTETARRDRVDELVSCLHTPRGPPEKGVGEIGGAGMLSSVIPRPPRICQSAGWHTCHVLKEFTLLLPNTPRNPTGGGWTLAVV